jgi:hypothetical protein
MEKLLTADDRLPKGHHYFCEHEHCNNKATVEWIYIESEDGEEHEIYYTFRCDIHPVKDPKFECRKIVVD